MHVVSFLLPAVLALLSEGAIAYRILFLAPLASRSHTGYYTSVVSTLAKHGHEMTYVTTFASKKKTTNIREIALPYLDVTPHMPNVFQDASMGMMKLLPLCAALCADGLEDPQVKILFDESFDLIMTAPTGECFLKFVHHFKIPFVMVTPNSLFPPLDEPFGNPFFPSYDLLMLLDGTPPLPFSLRAKNLFLDIFIRILTKSYSIPGVEKESRERGLFPDEMPSLVEIQRNASVIFLNSFRAMETPKAFVPTVIHAGGLHIRQEKPLPQDLEEWVQGSGDHGFIYFSLGSLANTEDMPEKYRLALVRGLGRLKQRVLWKWNAGHMEDLPPNVRVSDWLPQQDILAHPKVRLFISHGGIHSIQESLYHGVPILGMPVFGDQIFNLGKGFRQGWAYLLQWEDLTEETLVATVETALNNPKLEERVQQKSAIMRDLPMSPDETLVYWTEYVIRHGGADHLRCPARDMNWFLLYNFDVWTAISLAVCLVVYINFIFLRCCLRFCSRRCLRTNTKNKAD